MEWFRSFRFLLQVFFGMLFLLCVFLQFQVGSPEKLDSADFAYNSLDLPPHIMYVEGMYEFGIAQRFPPEGDAPITIHGSNFVERSHGVSMVRNGLRINVGEKPCKDIELVSEWAIICDLPPGIGYKIPVQMHVNDAGKFHMSNTVYISYDPTPLKIENANANRITVGGNFRHAKHIECFVSGAFPCTVKSFTNTQVVCELDRDLPVIKPDVEIRLNIDGVLIKAPLTQQKRIARRRRPPRGPPAS